MSARHLAELRRIDLFDDLDDEQLAEWVAVATGATSTGPASSCSSRASSRPA